MTPFALRDWRSPFTAFRAFQRPSVHAVIEIGSDVVSCVLVEGGVGGKPKLLLSSREPFSSARSGKFPHLLSTMARSLRTIADALGPSPLASVSRTGGFPRFVHCILHAPWYIGTLRTLTWQYQKDTLLTAAGIARVAAKEGEAILSEQRKKHHEPLSLVENKIVHLALNGYSVSSPRAVAARAVELTTFTVVVPVSIRERIEREITRNFHVERFDYHSFNLVAFGTAHALFPGFSHALLFLVEGEITEVLTVERGVPQELLSFPYGSQSFLRTVGEAVGGVEGPMVLSALRMTAEGKGSAALREKLRRGVVHAEDAWERQLEGAVGRGGFPFPPLSVIVVAPPAVSSSLCSLFSRRTLHDLLFRGMAPRVEVVTPDALEKIIDVVGRAERDPALMMAGFFVSRIEQEMAFPRR